jgi:hypothetical protein
MLWLILPSSNEAIECFSKEWTNSVCESAPNLRSNFNIENSCAICGVSSLGSGAVLRSATALDSANELSSQERSPLGVGLVLAELPSGGGHCHY